MSMERKYRKLYWVGGLPPFTRVSRTVSLGDQLPGYAGRWLREGTGKSLFYCSRPNGAVTARIALGGGSQRRIYQRSANNDTWGAIGGNAAWQE